MRPEQLDLALWIKDGERRMMVVARLDTGEVWRSAPVAYHGAIGALRVQVMARFPGLFASEDQVMTWLTTVHLRNTQRGCNEEGVDYPQLTL